MRHDSIANAEPSCIKALRISSSTVPLISWTLRKQSQTIRQGFTYSGATECVGGCWMILGLNLKRFVGYHGKP